MTKRLSVILAAAVVVVVAAAVAAWLLLRGGGSDGTGAFELTFDGNDPFQNQGTADLHPHVVTENGGRAQLVPGRTGGHALQLPAYQPANEPRAVVVVPPDAANSLSPGTGPFTFGADFKIDAVSQGSETDNGNNLIQRGLFTQPMQYKIEMDSDKPTCRVKGTDGDVIVRSQEHTVDPGTWYRVTCTRSGNGVTLRVTNLELGSSWTLAKTGPIGNVSSTEALLTVGGKTDYRGRLIGSGDQFNGIVDNAFFRRD